MRFERSVLSVSWIPSEAIEGVTRLPFDLGVTHYEDPPPDVVTDPVPLVAEGRVRFANHLRAWVEVEDDRIVGTGYSGGGHLALTTASLPGMDVVLANTSLPDLRPAPQVEEGAVTFVQSAGGRTSLPAPRWVRGRPFLRYAAPLAWTTLSLTIDRHGHGTGALVGASPFPRHWVYDHAGTLVAKSGSIDFDHWYRDMSDARSPWGEQDTPAFVTTAESALERQMSLRIMRGGVPPRMGALAPGQVLVEQGDAGTDLYLILDGVLAVEVDGDVVAEIGPGAVVGERAVLEGGTRTATLRALTPVRHAHASADELDRGALAELARGHRREDGDGR